MNTQKEDSKVKKAFDYDKKKKDKIKPEKGLRIPCDIKKGDFYKVTLHNNENGTGRVVDFNEKEIRFSEYTESDSTVVYEYTHKVDNIISMEPMIQSLQKEKSVKNNIVIVTMRTGTTGYGELQRETKDVLVLDNFVFFSDGSIPYDITIKKVLIREYLKLNVPVGDVIDSEELERTFQIDGEISKKKEGRVKEFQPFYSSTDTPVNESIHKAGYSKRGWNQFEVNEKLFGMKATFDESMYTTVLDKNSKEYKKYAHEAECIARKIDKPSSSNPHIEEERGRISNKPEDEKYGSAFSKKDPRRENKEVKESVKEVPREVKEVKESVKEVKESAKESNKECAKEVPREVKECAKESNKECAKEETKEIKEQNKETAVEVKDITKEVSHAEPKSTESGDVPVSETKQNIQKKNIISTPHMKSTSPKKQDKTKPVPRAIIAQEGVDLSDMVFSSMRNKNKADSVHSPAQTHDKEKKEEKKPFVKKVKPEDTQKSNTAPRQTGRRLNPAANMFDPVTAKRTEFVVTPGVAKQLRELGEAWTVTGQVSEALWKKPSESIKNENSEKEIMEKEEDLKKKKIEKEEEKKPFRNNFIPKKEYSNKYYKKP
ncbi:hypothetical protein NEIRO03_1262 [Nematocida sp. AWRm78]|nr:hypothetical protein NEIRO03_1262 [Nematocida sp. AWRm78]